MESHALNQVSVHDQQNELGRVISGENAADEFRRVLPFYQGELVIEVRIKT
jgi:hypothetical protein